MQSGVRHFGLDVAPNGMSSARIAFSDREFRLISDRIKKLCGIHLPESKRMLVYSRLCRRLKALDLTSFTDYLELLDGKGADKELHFAINALTTNLTRFFREPHHFDHLRSLVIPNIFTRANKGREIRFWSAGCSSGEEPYSIAMTVVDAVPSLREFDFKVIATDIDTDMLAQSVKGEYHMREHDSIPEPMRSRSTVSISSEADRFAVDARIRDLVSFEKQNLIDDWSFEGPIDVIFCRNVMIYFEPDIQKSIVERMSDLLPEGGFLYIGHSENLSRITESVSLVGSTVYTKKA